jgi:hypothetical protein
MTRTILRAALSLAGSIGLAAMFLTGVASADVNGNTNNTSQQGVQTSDSTQAAVVISGTANAVDASKAISGNVTAGTSFTGGQTLTLTQYAQSDLGSGLLVSGNTNGTAATSSAAAIPSMQSAMNSLTNQQQNGGQSGNASGAGTGAATTGIVNSQLTNAQTQLQTLLQSMQSTHPAP